MRDFKLLVEYDMLKNNPIALEDTNIAEKVFGPDMSSLKGKSTRKKPIPVVTDYLEIPDHIVENHREVILEVDAIFVNKIPFLMSYSQNLKGKTCSFIKNRTKAVVYEALDLIFVFYHKAGYRVIEVRADPEFAKIERHILEDEENDINLNLSSAQEHVPGVERSARTIKERVRAWHSRMPYTRVTEWMIVASVEETVKWHNCFPAKGGVSSILSF